MACRVRIKPVKHGDAGPAAAMIVIGLERCRPKTANSVHALLDRDGQSVVTSVWFSGAFTALGAVLGAGATLGAGVIGNRTQRGLAEASRKAEIADARRESYAEYLTAVYNFMDRARELIAKLEGDAGIAECDIVHNAYLEDWEHLQPAYAPVLIAGPSQIEESAEKLRFFLGSLADLCDGWYAARKSDTEFCDTKDALKAQLIARDARFKFASAARDYVYG
jgi:hypothetical protein